MAVTIHEQMYIDTHTHLYDDAFEGEGDEAVLRAVEAGVTKLIFPDINSHERDAMFDLAAAHPGVVFPCLGLHPTDVQEDWRDEVDSLMNYKESHGIAKGSKDIVAIGEIGVDCHWTKEFLDAQKETFRMQLDLAAELDLPVIIHNREATEIILNILEDYKGKGLRGVFHAFSGSYETFRELDKYGDFYVGIGGVVTYPKASIADTVKRIPLERILTETDSPYLTPVPHRGKRNESSYIPFIAGKIAQLKEVDTEEVAHAAWENAHALFDLG